MSSRAGLTQTLPSSTDELNGKQSEKERQPPKQLYKAAVSMAMAKASVRLRRGVHGALWETDAAHMAFAVGFVHCHLYAQTLRGDTILTFTALENSVYAIDVVLNGV